MTYKRYLDPWQAIEAKTEIQGECLIWTAPLHDQGYARVSSGGKRVYAHRFVWEFAHGPIPAGQVIDHSCRNRACLRLEHLRLATVQQNARNLSGSRRGSGHRNVHPRKHGFMVEVRVGAERHGHFHTDINDAISEAQALREEHYADFAGVG